LAGKREIAPKQSAMRLTKGFHATTLAREIT
jgi:hypothetical protein